MEMYVSSPVEVHWDGGWVHGELQAYRRHDDEWSARVAFTTAGGDHRLGWFPEHQVRTSD